MNEPAAFYTPPASAPPSMIRVVKHLSIAREELDRFIYEDLEDTGDERIYEAANLLDLAAGMLGADAWDAAASEGVQ